MRSTPEGQVTKKWDIHFLKRARLNAELSKDPSTKVGAVIVRGRRSVADGYNGFPSKIEDRPEWLADRNMKYALTVHAERNALDNAAREGIAVDDCTVYCTHMCCAPCLMGMLSTGIKRFVYVKNRDFEERWQEVRKLRAANVFYDCDIQLHGYEESDIV